MPGEAGVDEPGGRVGEQPSRPSDDLPSSRPARLSDRETTSNVEPSTNSPGCRTNGLVAVDLDERGQVVLLDLRVDVRVAVSC